MRDDGKREAAIMRILRLVAPGTALREGVENVLRARTGGLIVLGYDASIEALIDGGFSIQTDFSPARLYELAKMDGAIILSEDGRRILFANTQLNPDSSIPSRETGTRHRTAERVARQTGRLVLCISQRRHVITLYQEDVRYVLKDLNVIAGRANQALQTLERYKTVLDAALANLSALEIEEAVMLQDVIAALQRFEMVMRIREEIRLYITELGTEGRLVSMQLEELVSRVDEEVYLLVKDYTAPLLDVSPSEILDGIHALDAEDLLKGAVIASSLGYVNAANFAEQPVSSRGYRILHKIPRLPQPVIENLAEEFPTIGSIVSASMQELDEVDGIGEVRARAIKEGLRRVQEQAAMERHV